MSVTIINDLPVIDAGLIPYCVAKAGVRQLERAGPGVGASSEDPEEMVGGVLCLAPDASGIAAGPDLIMDGGYTV